MTTIVKKTEYYRDGLLLILALLTFFCVSYVCLDHKCGDIKFTKLICRLPAEALCVTKLVRRLPAETLCVTSPISLKTLYIGIQSYTGCSRDGNLYGLNFKSAPMLPISKENKIILIQLQVSSSFCASVHFDMPYL